MSDIKDYVIEDGVLVKYTGKGGNVEIPEDVTRIGKEAFKDNANLTHVTIPESVTKIGWAAFWGCTGLNGVLIPESVTGIGGYAFKGCTGLTNVIIPESVTETGSAFFDCRNLVSVILPKGLSRIDGTTFAGCSNLKEIEIPEGVVMLSSKIFDRCEGLERVTIPRSIKIISRDAFIGCPNLKEVHFDGDILEWLSLDRSRWEDTPLRNGAELYINGTLLRDLVLPDGVAAIGKDAFKCCMSLESVTIPTSLVKIDYGAFFGCSNVKRVYYSSLEAWLALDQTGWKDSPMRKGAALYLNGEIVQDLELPDGVTKIGENAFCGCISLKSVSIPEGVIIIDSSAFYGCSDLGDVIIPASVERIGRYAFGKCEKLHQLVFRRFLQDVDPDWFKSAGLASSSPMPSLVFPEGSFATKEKLSTDYCKMEICVSDREIAFLKLYQKGKAWESWLRKKINQNGADVFDHMLAQFEADKKAPAVVFADFMTDHLQGLSSGQVRRAMELLEKRKYKGLADLREIYGIAHCLKEEPIDENPIEARVRELCKASPLLPEAMEAVKKGIPYAASKQLCSREAVAFILSEYVKEWHRCAGEVYFPRYNTSAEGLTNGRMIDLHPEADEIADELDRSSLSDVFEKLCDGIRYRPWLLAWARYANDASVNRMTSTYKTMIKGQAKDYYKANSMREALLINDTFAAIQFFDRIGELDEYAKMRGMTAMEMRDIVMLPTFDFDADGVKRYDIGGNTIEVNIAPDLSFRLFDVNKQKEIRSFPKKSDDPAKAEACAKDYAAFKKEVLAFAKERTELMHKMHMSGEYVREDLWQRVYVEHPVASRLARLVVWQDEAGKTFMITDDGIIDSLGNIYVPQGKIRVAHVLDMDTTDITAWQQWLAKHGCAQLFEQVWEPVITWHLGGIADRYNGATLSNEERNAVKKALKLRGVDMRAAEMDREYNHRTGEWEYSNEGTMLFGDCLKVDYIVDADTKTITFGTASTKVFSANREMNAVLLEMDKAVVSAQVTRDNEAALTDQALSVFSAAQIASLLNLAIDSKATRCTARLLNYKNAHFPVFAEVSEFSLDW